MNLNQAQTFIITKLQKELNPLLSYHNVEHTLGVFNATKLICEGEKIDKQNTVLLLTAALYHDSGFLVDRKNHEEHSCELAKKHLPQFNYTDTDIDFICKIIMATQVHYEPKTIFEKIIKDADLDYLGTDNYFKTSEQLFTELKNFNLISSNELEWLDLQIDFLIKHEYYTKTSKNNKAVQKQSTLNLLLERQKRL